MNSIQYFGLSVLLAASVFTLSTTEHLKLERRVIDGYDVNPAFKYTFMASIQKNGKVACGGTLINGNTLVTAAQCTTGCETEFEVLLHRHDLNKTDTAESGQRYKVLKRINHPNFDSSNNANDISVWKLKSYNSSPIGIELDNGTYSSSYNLYTTAGWGAKKKQGPPSTVLSDVQIPYINGADCVQKFTSINKVVDPKTQICAGYDHIPRGSCQGDQGGPLFITKEGKTVLVGISSWAISCDYANLPSVFTKVVAYSDWIKANL